MEINIRDGAMILQAVKIISKKYNLEITLGEALEIVQNVEDEIF